MKKIALMTVVLAVMTSPALAQDQAALCKLWFVNKNAAKSAAYQPGVDVNGKPVVPADGGAAPAIPVANNIRIPVTMALAKQLGAAIPANMTDDAIAGVVNIGGNGRVSYNGQDLTQATYTLCNGPAYEEAAAPAPVTSQPAVATAATLPAAQPAAASDMTPEPSDAKPAVAAVNAKAATVVPMADETGLSARRRGAVYTPESTAVPIDEKDIIWGEGN